MNHKIILLAFATLLLFSCGIHEDEPWSETWLSIIDSDGDNLQHLVKDVYGNPKFSYDGKKIVIANNEGFHIANLDGNTISCVEDELLAHNNYYSISNLSNDLIFSDANNVYKLNFINGEHEKITDFKKGFIGRPSYSSDSDKIIFSWSTSINGIINNVIYIMNEDGSNMSPVLEDSTGIDRMYNPTFIASDEKIAFSKPFQGIYICNLDGSNLEQHFVGNVASDPIKTGSDFIVFTSASREVFSYNYDNDSIISLGFGDMPDVSKNSLETTMHDNALYLVDIDGCNRTKIASSSHIYQSFSHDGRLIVFLGKIKHNTKKSNNPLE